MVIPGNSAGRSAKSVNVKKSLQKLVLTEFSSPKGSGSVGGPGNER
jgi:hypothetical protein